jgi:hypothetical protein
VVSRPVESRFERLRKCEWFENHPRCLLPLHGRSISRPRTPRQRRRRRRRRRRRQTTANKNRLPSTASMRVYECERIRRGNNNNKEQRRYRLVFVNEAYVVPSDRKHGLTTGRKRKYRARARDAVPKRHKFSDD